jgi:hypothetical protein
MRLVKKKSNTSKNRKNANKKYNDKKKLVIMEQATIPLPGAVPITATSATQQKVLLLQRARHLQRVHLATNIQVLRENILHPAP